MRRTTRRRFRGRARRGLARRRRGLGDDATDARGRVRDVSQRRHARIARHGARTSEDERVGETPRPAARENVERIERVLALEDPEEGGERMKRMTLRWFYVYVTNDYAMNPRSRARRA